MAQNVSASATVDGRIAADEKCRVDSAAESHADERLSFSGSLLAGRVTDWAVLLAVDVVAATQ